MDRADLWARVDARDVDRCVDAATRVGASAARWCIARDACIVDVCVRVVGRRGGSRCLLVLTLIFPAALSRDLFETRDQQEDTSRTRF